MKIPFVPCEKEKFESARLSYREICAADTEDIVRWRSDPAIYKYYRIPKPLTIKKHLEWYEDMNLSNPSRLDFIIIKKESLTPIGIVGIHGLESNLGEIGYTIETTFQGHGYATESVNAIVGKYVEAGIRVFHAEIHSENTASVRVIEKCGFCFNKQLESSFLLYEKKHTLENRLP